MASASHKSPPTEQPKKTSRLLFKRTVPRRKTDEPRSDSLDAGKAQEEVNDLKLFRHREDVFPMAFQEDPEEEATSSPGKHGHKRRKVSLEGESETTPARGFTPLVSGASGERKSSLAILESGDDDDLIMDVKGRGEEKLRRDKIPTPRKSASVPKSPIALSDDGDHDDYKPVISPPNRSMNNYSSTRLRQRKKDSSPVDIPDSKHHSGLSAGATSDLEEISPPNNEDEPLDDELSKWTAKAREREALTRDTVVVYILTSQVPNTKPLHCRRRMNQTMKVLLDTFISTQRMDGGLGIPDDEAATMFLTWKGLRVSNFSSAASLGVQVDENGALKGDGEGYFRGGLQLEVWTPEGYEAYTQEKERKRALKLGLADDGDDDDSMRKPAVDERAPSLPAQGRVARLILKAKELEPCKTRVHEGTTVGILIQGYRNSMRVGLERVVEIFFDGEKLDENSLVMDADLDPDEVNQMEVIIR
ncbi:hypothetical protein B0H66DRAFT_590791 [Apodospora peruviana]|uniref:Rad60/SUMO-like domain-containing protein n=1 Tax=Apodospora peruviana TaxID=516989 RepID=A0AAE0I3P9_9PEZI|nr:hypothetical protein B0H66DRAFT_590791 [Apodospora peruviana]